MEIDEKSHEADSKSQCINLVGFHEGHNSKPTITNNSVFCSTSATDTSSSLNVGEFPFSLILTIKK